MAEGVSRLLSWFCLLMLLRQQGCDLSDPGDEYYGSHSHVSLYNPLTVTQ